MRILLLINLFLLTFLVYSCTKSISVSGEYLVVKKSLDDWLFLKKMKSDGRIVGSQLSLKPDSSFLYLNCGSQMTGYWRTIEDSLFLYATTNVYRSDSLKSIGTTIIPEKPIVFLLRKEQLYRVWDFKNSNKSVELLTKKK